MGQYTWEKQASIFVRQRVAHNQRDIRNKKDSNGFYAHVKKNKGDKEKYWRGRKVKEALFINVQNPTEEINWEKVMNLEMVLLWTQFKEISMQR